MKIVALTCPQCGGSQDVSDDQRTLDCRYCNVALRVERLPNGELERLLVEAREENSLLLIRNRMLKIQNTIHRIDDEWELSRKKFMIKTKQGEREPAANAILLGYVMGCGIALFGIMIALNGKSGAMVGLVLPIMGLVVICMGTRKKRPGGQWRGHGRTTCRPAGSRIVNLAISNAQKWNSCAKLTLMVRIDLHPKVAGQDILSCDGMKYALELTP
jgi:hypothetical protein